MVHFTKLLPIFFGIGIVLSAGNLTSTSNLNSATNDVNEINTRAGNQLKKSVLDFLKDLFIPTIIQDLYKLFVLEPPKKLSKSRGVKHGGVEGIKKNIVRSLISICPAEKILNHECLCKKTYTNIKIIENDDFDALVTVATDEADKLIIVSYRASLTAENWVNNFKYPMVDVPSAYPGVKVHHGFYSTYLSTYFEVRKAVTALLDKSEYKDYTLHITGYSLGAACATISLPDWVALLKSRSDSRPIEGYAYASPRPGNEIFAQYIASLNIPVTRYTNRNDIVPHLPPRSGGFVHAAPEIHERYLGLGKTELVACSQEYDEDPECGWRDKIPVSAAMHLLPLNGLIPLPPYC